MIWQTLMKRRLYQSPTACVFENGVYRWLTLDSKALQTVLNKWLPHRAGLNYLQGLTLAACQKPGLSCLLGLGGAGAAHLLAPFLKNNQLIAIECNPEIIYLAKHFFMTKNIMNLTIIDAEASYYIQQCQQSFYHIMVDLFTKDAFPISCQTHLFFKNCYERLAPDGILAINIANHNERQIIFNLLTQHFGLAIVTILIKNCANIILLANKKSTMHLINNYFNNPQIKKLYWQANWGYIAEI